jgi:hypothetical protein
MEVEEATFTTPIAIDDESTTYIADLTTLYALDATGNLRWQHDAALEGGPTLGHNRDVLAPASAGFSVLDGETGDSRWSSEYPCGSAAVGEDYRLYGVCSVDNGNGGLESHLVVFDSDGTVQFEAALGDDGLGTGSANFWNHRLYVAEEHIDVLVLLASGKLFYSLLLIQVFLGTVVPFALLGMMQIFKNGPTTQVRRDIYFLCSQLILLGVLAMRWNVVIGGQLFSKSLRGFTTYKLELIGQEGLFMSAVLLVLPFVILAIMVALFLPKVVPELGKGAAMSATPKET